MKANWPIALPLILSFADHGINNARLYRYLWHLVSYYADYGTKTYMTAGDVHGVLRYYVDLGAMHISYYENKIHFILIVAYA